MPSRLHTWTSALTHSLQDLLGLPHPLGLGIVILVIEFVHKKMHAQHDHTISDAKFLVQQLFPESLTLCTGFPWGLRHVV